jgi:spore coat protein U-like protein
MKRILMILAVASVVLVSVNAMAATDTSNLTSTVIVQTICTISSVTNLDFGTYDPTSATNDDDGVGDVTFRCTKNTAYDVYITGARTMTDGTDTLNFEMYTDTPGGTVWPSALPGVSGTTADNSPITQNIYGRIPALQDVEAGTYNGTVVVTVEY